MQIEIDREQEDRIVIESLKDNIRFRDNIFIEPWETHDDKAAILNAMFVTLQYYTSEREYQEFLEEMKDESRNSL